jgi:PAS domain S-box-containing protein
MSAKHFRIIALQSVFALFVFLLFVYFFVKYDSEQMKNQVNNIGQTLTFAIEEDVNFSEGVLASFAYNYEIDPDLDVAEFEILAKHYLKVNPEIIYVQRKDRETTTIMVYPETFNYTLGATLMSRPEVEEAVLKSIKDKIVTANSPFILKDTDDILGLVIRYPLYHEETFDGFFVVVLNIDNFFKGIIDAEMMKDYNISFFDDNEKLFWGYDGQHKGQVYVNNIAILDNFWTIQVSMKNNMMASTLAFVMGTSILFLLVVGLLVVMQIRLIKKDQNIQQLAISKKELEKVKESYTLALDSANDALWEWNITTGEIYTSDKWKKINGYEKIGQRVDAILQKENIHPKDYEQSVFALEACLSGEKHTFDITYRTKNPSGNYSWIQNRGKVYLDDRGHAKILAGSISNITERKVTEFKLVESEELLSRAQELAHIGSWNLDLTTNKLYWSDETYRIFGCEPQEFTATYEVFLKFIYPDDRAEVEEAYSRSVREKNDSYEIEHRILRQSTGEIRHVYERCVHVRDDAGDIIQSIGMVQDITEKHAAENEQRKLLEQVQRDRRTLLSTLEDQRRIEESLRESEATVRKKLRMIVDPEGDISTFELSEIIDVEIMQSLMEKFYQATGMLGAVLDQSGKVVVAFGWQDICTKFHRCHPDTAKNCLQSDTVLTQGVPPGTIRSYKCKNNLWDMVTPLMVGGRHLGNVFFGQFFYEGEAPDVELFRAQAQQYGFDETEYLAALARVPHLNRHVAEAGLLFCTQMASIVATLSHSAIKQARMLTVQQKAEESLKTYASRLINLHQTDQAIIQAIDPPEKITQGAIQHIRDLLDSQRVSVGMFDFDKKEVRIFAASGDADSVVQIGQVLPEELFGDMDILQENKLEIIEDSLKMETDSTILRTIHAEGVRSYVNAPIRSPKGLIGALSIGWETARTITSEEQEIASEVASQIAIAIEQSRLLQETKQHAVELEEKIRRRTVQLEAKTRELETFSYSVAHDLKAPLRGIDGYSRLLLEGYYDRLDEEGRQFLNTIRQSAEQMNQLIEDLLAYSRLERRPAQEHPHNLRMLTQTAISGFEIEFQRRSGTVNINVPDIVVNVDSEGLTIALRNLLDNALKYTPFIQQPVIEIGAEIGEKAVVLWIRDNGIGFDMKYHDRIFGIFNRLHRSEEYPGTGIGLAMVRKALERLGGRVWAESQPEKGATFYIEIPLSMNEEIRNNNERS